MSDLGLSGLASGVDTDSVVAQLMALERQQLTKYTYRQRAVTAEQGLIGLVVYLALIAVALWTMGRGLWRKPLPPLVAARAAVLAAFVALLVHTLAYAGFFEDPLTWVLLAVGASLAHAEAGDDPVIRKPT